MAKLATGNLDAKFMSKIAKQICKHEHISPRWYERLNVNKSTYYDAVNPEQKEYPVMRVWNTRREIVITNYDMTVWEMCNG